MLAEEFPPAAFCEASFRAIADENSAFPTWAILRTALTTWLEQHMKQAEQKFDGEMITPYLLEKVMEGCNGNPGPMLASWLNKKGVYPDARGIWPGTARMAAERAEAVRSWSDPANVTASLQRLRGHPREAVLTDMLHGLVKRHAPQNLGLFDSVPVPVPVAFPTDGALFGEV